MATSVCRPVFFNPEAKPSVIPASDSGDAPLKFHRSLPGFLPTKLVPLESVAKKVGVRSVLLKFEGRRLEVPSFKILGASWGTFSAITRKLAPPIDSDLATMEIMERPLPHMGTLLGIPTEIFVPAGLHQSTSEAIKDEGPIVTQINASYDETAQETSQAATRANGILIQDTAFPGYEEIPTWVVEDYSTMHLEIDEELGGVNPNLVIPPVGQSFTRVLTVEPDAAACLYKSLVAGEVTSIETIPTIMTGLDCGTVSSIAWPILKAVVDASTTVSDYEAHESCKLLKSLDVHAGPCGAASLAALLRLTPPDEANCELNESSTVVLFCTEEHREYNTSPDVSLHDALSLAQALVQIDSAVPGTGNVRGGGETEIARHIAAWLEHRDIETHWLESTQGRPSIISVVRGTTGDRNGKNIMLNGHIDTVTIAGYDGDPLSGSVQDGKLYGRDAADMKCGVAAILVALATAKTELFLPT